MKLPEHNTCVVTDACYTTKTHSTGTHQVSNSGSNTINQRQRRVEWCNTLALAVGGAMASCQSGVQQCCEASHSSSSSHLLVEDNVHTTP